MTIAFSSIPASLRVPFYFAEAVAAPNGDAASGPPLIAGQLLAAGTATAGELVQVFGPSHAEELFGAGSQIATAIAAYRAIDSVGELWALPMADVGGATAASGSITVTGPASADGTIALLVGGRSYTVAVTSGDTADDIAQDIADAITADTSAIVTAAFGGAGTGDVDLEARNGGTTGNAISIAVDHYATTPLPAGVSLSLPSTSASGLGWLTSGATDPAVADVLAAMGDELFDVLAQPWTTPAALVAWGTGYGDASGRWAWSRQVYGHVLGGANGTVTALLALVPVATVNDPHLSIVDAGDAPTPGWAFVAILAARAALSVAQDPGAPLTGAVLTGAIAPRVGYRRTLAERQALLEGGISTVSVSGSTVYVERVITTYREDAHGGEDTTFLDAVYMWALAEVLRRLRAGLESRFSAYRIVPDETPYGAGLRVTTPSEIWAEAVAIYGQAERDGLVEGTNAFAAAGRAERNAANPRRVDLLFPIDLVDPLRILAVRAEVG